MVKYGPPAVNTHHTDSDSATVNVLMRFLTAIRERSNHAGASYEWTEEKNARRCHLIDKKLQGSLADDEAGEYSMVCNRRCGAT